MTNKDTKPEEEKIDPTSEFVDEFEKLAEKYGIDKYVAYVNVENRPIMLWKPKELTEATKMAKLMHQNFYQQIMVAIGEVKPPPHGT